LTHIARKSLGFYRELTGPATFDLNESVEETLNIYLKRFEAKHIGVERNYTQGLMLFAIKGEIRQVISNLLVNAYDVLPEYGMLRVETAGSGDQVCFRVADNGQGIPEDILPRIFEPFYTTKEDTGNGLGLWVSDTIVQKHGGRIEVESATEEKHRGTTFTVTLPRIAPKAA
jgi:two-component system, NtrC family, sensor kinase